MYKILIADLSAYREAIGDILTENGYEIMFSDSAFDAISKLRAYDFDLIVSEVELPGDNAFDLYEYMKENYPFSSASEDMKINYQKTLEYYSLRFNYRIY